MSSDSRAGNADDATDAADGYVHRPSDWDGDDRATGDADDRAGGDPDANSNPDGGEDLGRAGWVLVGVVVVAFLVVPGVIYLRPTGPAELGLGFLAAMLVLPFVPAILLGITAVWSLAVGRNRQ